MWLYSCYIETYNLGSNKYGIIACIANYFHITDHFLYFIDYWTQFSYEITILHLINSEQLSLHFFQQIR